MRSGWPAYLLVLFFSAVFFAVGFWLGGTQKAPLAGKDNRGFAIRQNGYTFTNPILDYEIVNELDFTELSSFRGKLEELIKKEIGKGNASRISVYFRDLNNGPWIGIGERDYFSPASLSKVPVMMAILKEAELDPALLQKKVKFGGNAYVNQKISVNSESLLEANKEYTVEELTVYMIKNSDNVATEVLVKELGINKLLRIYKDLNLPVPQPDQSNEIAVKNYSSFFRILYNASYLNREMSEKALELLSQAEYDQALAAGVPSSIKVANKFGQRSIADSGEDQLHDCGIVYHPKWPYLLCIMTRGDDTLKLIETVKKISSLVYYDIESQTE